MERFFTPSEVAAHNIAEDLWVSFLGKVLDLSPIMEKHKGDALLLPILERAGGDISNWFDPNTEDLLTCVDPITCLIRYHTPRGRVLHTPPSGPRSDWAVVDGAPWWRDSSLQVGRVTERSRWVRIINTLTSEEQLLQVCSEDTLARILQRYLFYNRHADSYTWKHGGRPLDMSRTLSENGIHDNTSELDQLSLDRDLFIPDLLLHYNDDLTEA
ncbi:cytochrome b5 domain-containing protein 1 [Gouania willdenowi]|uniref:cytochrome b5 domain-containing protein 1 n=1 Tax=Gouania willdenowi TaxID=441366 RepID=UPI001055E293|nr:cytochrome b5 domain-containing protein 1 [Gouania willdenowi]